MENCKNLKYADQEETLSDFHPIICPYLTGSFRAARRASSTGEHVLLIRVHKYLELTAMYAV